jgi:hypothetical protein
MRTLHTGLTKLFARSKAGAFSENEGKNTRAVRFWAQPWNAQNWKRKFLSPLFFLTAYIHFREWNPGTDRKIFRQILLMNLSNNKVRTTHSLNEQIFNQPRQFANGKKELTKEELIFCWRVERGNLCLRGSKKAFVLNCYMKRIRIGMFIAREDVRFI